MNDLRYAARTLSRSPGSTLLVSGLLAAGIAANVAIFTVFNAILLRPLPVHDPDHLVRVVQRVPQVGTTSYFPYRLYESLRDQSSTLSAVFGEEELPIGMNEPQPVEQVRVRVVTPEFFDVLGVPAMLGRALTADDALDHPGAPPAVLSYSFWQRRFNADPNIVGKFIALEGHKFTIRGVMPRDFNGISMDTSPEVRVPLRVYPMLSDLSNYPPNLGWRDTLQLDLSARLKPGVKREQAQAEALSRLDAIASQLPEVLRSDRGLLLDPLDRGTSMLRDRFSGVLKLLIASAALLLLLVCANVAGLLLARSATRREEVAVRLAIGATRARLLRQMLTESAMLAALGALGGIAIAFLAMPVLARSIPVIRDRLTYRVPLSIDLHPDVRVLLFTLAISAVTVLLFGLAPALGAAGQSLESVLRQARSIGGNHGRQLLIVIQIALCTMLLAGAGLLLRTFSQLRDLDPGFDAAHIVSFTAFPWLGNYSSARIQSLRIALTGRVRALPGVSDVAVASVAVMRGSGFRLTLAPAGEEVPNSDFLNTSGNNVTPEYFETMGMRIVSGRAFTAADADAKPPRVVVNEAFARHLFGNRNPIGQSIGFGWRRAAKAELQIIGVVQDAKYRSLREPMIPTVYNFWRDAPSDRINLYVRTRMRPDAIIQPAREILAQLGPALPFTEINTMSEEIDASAAPERLTASLASIFAALAALLAAIGIYGLLAYAVAERRREIGIRMALGARALDIAKMIGWQAVAMTAAGVAIGLAAAIFTAPLVRALLYGVAPLDPMSFALAATFVMILTIVASAIPAMRAARIDPAIALRQEN